MSKPYTEIPISKETRETIAICSKDALLHHLNDIKQGVNKLQVFPVVDNTDGYDEIMNKINNLIANVKKYS